MRVLVLCVLLCAHLALGADKKGQVSLETNSAKVLVSTKKVGKYDVGCAPSFCAVYVRVQNLTDAPVDIGLAGAFMKTTDGKGLPWMPGDEAAKMLIGKTAVLMTTLATGSDLRKPMQQDLEARMLERALPSGPVPPKAFVEGLVWFRGSGDKKNRPSSLHLTGLVPAPIPLSW